MSCDYQHAGERCTSEATRIGLLQVANPSASRPEGIQVEVGVCEYHSYRWGSLWGTWPIPEIDCEPEPEPVDCRPMSGFFRDARMGGYIFILEGDYVGYYQGSGGHNMARKWYKRACKWVEISKERAL